MTTTTQCLHCMLCFYLDIPKWKKKSHFILECRLLLFLILSFIPRAKFSTKCKVDWTACNFIPKTRHCSPCLSHSGHKTLTKKFQVQLGERDNTRKKKKEKRRKQRQNEKKCQVKDEYWLSRSVWRCSCER